MTRAAACTSYVSNTDEENRPDGSRRIPDRVPTHRPRCHRADHRPRAQPRPDALRTTIIIAVYVGLRIAAPRLYRLVASAACLWAKTVLKIWRLWDDRRAIRDSEKNMRAAVISETQQLADLGKEET